MNFKMEKKTLPKKYNARILDDNFNPRWPRILPIEFIDYRGKGRVQIRNGLYSVFLDFNEIEFQELVSAEVISLKASNFFYKFFTRLFKNELQTH